MNVSARAVTACGVLFVFMVASLDNAFAFEKFTEYRIAGDQIKEITKGTVEIESPATILISFQDDTDALALESDQPIDDCFDTLNSLIGDDLRYAQIRVHETALTMNGVLITECAAISRR
ncbi:MAG: hypothetical protein ABJN26_14630 [Stappiaceae bacterium]